MANCSQLSSRKRQTLSAIKHLNRMCSDKLANQIRIITGNLEILDTNVNRAASDQTARLRSLFRDCAVHTNQELGFLKVLCIFVILLA